MNARIDGKAARLPSRNPEFLVDFDLKAALDEFMRGTHASDTTAEDHNFRPQCHPPSRSARFRSEQSWSCSGSTRERHSDSQQQTLRQRCPNDSTPVLHREVGNLRSNERVTM